MSSVFALYGFLSVLLHVLELAAQSVLFGSVAFLVLAVSPLAHISTAHAALLRASSLTLVRISAWILCAATLVATALNAAVLAESLQIPWRDVLPARFAIAGAIKALAAAAAAVAARRAHEPRLVILALLTVAILVILAATLATTHAAARPVLEAPLLIATALHQAGAALWLGGLPCFYRALRLVRDDPASRAWLGRRYSSISIAGVALIVAGASILAIGFIGSWGAAYGTPYGAMAETKGFLLVLLLTIGCANFFAVRRFGKRTSDVARVRRFVEIEMAVAVAVLALAASMTSAPPAVDLAGEEVTYAELVERLTPKAPRLQTPDASSLAIATLQRKLEDDAARAGLDSRPRAYTPGSGELPPRNAQDIAWSEYNHHWAGLLVLLIGIFALLERAGLGWARHWPLLFLGLALFILLRADPEVWPLGHIGLIESLKDPEVVQHRLFAILTAAFAWFEWRVRTGRFRSPNLALFFPALMVVGGILLLAHTHAINDVKDQVLIEWSHLPLGVLGITGGAARWLQLRAESSEGRWAGWVWPVCLVLTGLVLLNYREA